MVGGAPWPERSLRLPAAWQAVCWVLGVSRGVRHSPFCQGAHSLVGEHTSKQASQETCGIK